MLLSIYLGGTTSSLTIRSNLLYLLRKRKTVSIIKTNVAVQPIALPTITFMLLHLSFEPGIEGVGSKLNRFSPFPFKKQNKFDFK